MMSHLKLTVFCVAALVSCGCEQGQPMPPAPTADKQATSDLTAPDFAAMKKDAESANATAQTSLGVMYENGEGVPQDYVEAYVWFSVAAASGDADSANNRGIAAGELTPEQLSQGQKRATELFEKISSGK